MATPTTSSSSAATSTTSSHTTAQASTSGGTAAGLTALNTLVAQSVQAAMTSSLQSLQASMSSSFQSALAGIDERIHTAIRANMHHPTTAPPPPGPNHSQSVQTPPTATGSAMIPPLSGTHGRGGSIPSTSMPSPASIASIPLLPIGGRTLSCRPPLFSHNSPSPW